MFQDMLAELVKVPDEFPPRSCPHLEPALAALDVLLDDTKLDGPSLVDLFFEAFENLGHTAAVLAEGIDLWVGAFVPVPGLPAPSGR